MADEVYHLLNFTARRPTPFASFAGSGKIISLGSFSKILAPGLRLGWNQTDPARVKTFVECGLINSGGGLNPFTSAIILKLIESNGLKENIQKLCSIYQTRSAAMDAALRKYLPEAAYAVPQGGYFYWIRLPNGRDAQALMKRAEDFQVSFRPGVLFSSQGGLRDWARLCFAFYEADQLTAGVERLKRALE